MPPRRTTVDGVRPGVLRSTAPRRPMPALTRVSAGRDPGVRTAGVAERICRGSDGPRRSRVRPSTTRPSRMRFDGATTLPSGRPPLGGVMPRRASAGRRPRRCGRSPARRSSRGSTSSPGRSTCGSSRRSTCTSCTGTRSTTSTTAGPGRVVRRPVRVRVARGPERIVERITVVVAGQRPVVVAERVDQRGPAALGVALSVRLVERRRVARRAAGIVRRCRPPRCRRRPARPADRGVEHGVDHDLAHAGGPQVGELLVHSSKARPSSTMSWTIVALGDVAFGELEDVVVLDGQRRGDGERDPEEGQRPGAQDGSHDNRLSGAGPRLGRCRGRPARDAGP